MRKPRTNKTDIDFSKPISLDILEDSNDCFGKMYDPTTVQCSMCGDSSLCAVKFRGVNNKLKSVARQNKKILSDYNFDKVRNSKLSDKLKEGKYTRPQLFEAVTAISRCNESELVNDFIDGFLLEHELKIVNGVICTN